MFLEKWPGRDVVQQGRKFGRIAAEAGLIHEKAAKASPEGGRQAPRLNTRLGTSSPDSTDPNATGSPSQAA